MAGVRFRLLENLLSIIELLNVLLGCILELMGVYIPATLHLGHGTLWGGNLLGIPVMYVDGKFSCGYLLLVNCLMFLGVCVHSLCCYLGNKLINNTFVIITSAWSGQ